jgi:hypothetical protein
VSYRSAGRFGESIRGDALTGFNSRDSGFFDFSNQLFGLLILKPVAGPVTRFLACGFVQVVQAVATGGVGTNGSVGDGATYPQN